MKSDGDSFRGSLFYLLRKWNLLNLLSDKLFVRFGYYRTFGEKLYL